MKAIALAKLTFNEIIKERFFFGLLVADIIFCFISYFLSEISAGDNVKIAMDFILAFQFFSTAIYTILTVTNSFQKDLHQKVIYLIYSKPITKKEYLLGKLLGFVGAFSVLSFCLYVLNTIAMITINKISMLVVPHLILTERMLLFTISLSLMLTLLTSLGSLFAVSLSNSSLAAFVTFLTFLAGLEISAVKDIATAASYISDINKKLISFLYYTLPNFSLFDIKSYVVHTLYEKLNPLYLPLLGLYTLLYVSALFFLSANIFERKEL